MRLSSLADGKLTEMTGVEMLVALGVAVGLVGVVVPVVPGRCSLGRDPRLGHRHRDDQRLGGRRRGDGPGGRRPGRQVHDPRQAAEGKRRSQPLAGDRRPPAIVGFFAIPVVGLLDRVRHGRLRLRAPAGRRSNGLAFDEGRPHAVGVSMLIELMSVLLATAVWIIGVIAT